LIERWKRSSSTAITIDTEGRKPSMTAHHRHDGGGPGWSRGRWALIAFLAIAGYFLIAEHKAHLTGWLATYWIWLVLLACPLLHLFMHGGHGHGGDGSHGHGKRGERDE
jgi:hypothetical protein